MYFVFIISPKIAVEVRRLYDTGRSGFYLLLIFYPGMSDLILIYFLAQDSEPKTNIYGPSPKYGNDDNCSEIGLTKSINISNKSNYVPPSQNNFVIQGNVVIPQS